MKYYMIEDTTAFSSSWNSHILVKANNKKEALERMWLALGYDNQEQDIKNGYKPHYKKEFIVTELDKYFEKENFYGSEVAVIH